MATGKANVYTNDWLKLIFNAVAWANMADNAASSPYTNLYISLHTADPGATGDQTTNEIGYTSYARVAVVRTSSGFTVSGETVTLANNTSFPAGTGGSGTATYVGIGTAASGAGILLYRATLTPNIVCGSGVTPVVNSGGTGIVES